MNIENPTEDEIRSIFNPRANFYKRISDKSYQWIAEAVKMGLLTLSKSSVKIDYLLPLAPQHGSESTQHSLLKANAEKLLRDLGETEISFEGFDFSDVFGETLKIRVECGQTDGVRVERSLGYISEFWVLPYSNFEIVELYKFKINYPQASG